MVTYLDSLVQLCCGEGETLPANTPGGCGERAQCPGHTSLPLLTAGVLPRSTLLRLQLALQGNCLRRPGLRALPRPTPLRFRFSGAAQRRRLGWACVSCPSQARQLRGPGAWCAPSPQVGARLAPSPAPPAGFQVRSGSAVSGVPWVSSGSWSLRPS